MAIQYIVTDNSITLLLGGIPKVVPQSHKNFEDIEQALIKGQTEEFIKTLVDESEQMKVFVMSDGESDVEVRDGELFYKGTAINSSLSRRIVSMKEKGFDISPFTKFMENLYNNPSYRAVNELYGFLEACNLPITEDGHFLAYKKITGDYLDVYTRTLDNSIGKTVEMARNQVNEDANQTCSFGLHVASYSYMSSYSGQRIVICKINPADVVAVPVDYNNAKMRVCKYEVVNEISMDGTQIEEDVIKDEDVYHEDCSVNETPDTRTWSDECMNCGVEYEEDCYCDDYSPVGYEDDNSTPTTKYEGDFFGGDETEGVEVVGADEYQSELKQSDAEVKETQFATVKETLSSEEIASVADNVISMEGPTLPQLVLAYIAEGNSVADIEDYLASIHNIAVKLTTDATEITSTITILIKEGKVRKKAIKRFLRDSI